MGSRWNAAGDGGRGGIMWGAILGIEKLIPWKSVFRVGAAFVLFAVPLGIAAWIGYQLGTAHMEDALLEQAQGFEERIRIRNEILTDVRRTLDENARLLEEVQSDLDEANSKPPEVVIRYRDRIREVSRVIRSEECPKALGEAIAVIRDLAAIEEEGDP
jgi:hypothetical protein